jgi:L-alanine-DL-glutamate epimerase-like enolase superfamily enzyme
MKIKRVRAYQINLPVGEGSYKWSGGNFVNVFDSTVVEIQTDEGFTGYGEVCPLGPAYLPAYAAGARTGIATLAPHLIGTDPTELAVVNEKMDRSLRGHAYVKSALDVACWDILGKSCNKPIVTLLGGRFGKDYPLYRAISQESPGEMAEMVSKYRKEGYSKFQLKVGGSPDTDVERIKQVRNVLSKGEVLVADANTGWTRHGAMRVADQVRDVDVYLEQPCMSYEECLSVREHTSKPFVLDEVIDNLSTVVRAISDRAMDVVNLKISKVGGLTKARQIRDLCASEGIALTIEDTWGGDIVTAAIAHLAHSTPTNFLFSTTDFNSYVTLSIAENAPIRHEGRMEAPSGAGLGVKPRMEVLGKAVIDIV